jgi:hypothetical protein
MNLENRRENTKRKRKLELSLRLGRKTTSQPTYSLGSAHNFSLLSPAAACKTWHVSLTRWVDASVLTPTRALLGMRTLLCGPSMSAPSSPPRLNRKAPRFTRLAACNSSSRAQKSRHSLTRGICALQNPTGLGRFSPRL